MIRLYAALVAILASIVFSLAYFNLLQIQTQQITQQLVKLTGTADEQRKEISRETSALTNITLHFDAQNKILLKNISKQLNPMSGASTSWRHNTTMQLQEILNILRENKTSHG